MRLDYFDRAKSGVYWLAAMKLFCKFCDFIVFLFIMHFCDMREYGFFIASWIIVAALETFTYLGLDSALINSHTNFNEEMDCAWTLQAVRGIVLFFILLISSLAGYHVFHFHKIFLMLVIFSFHFLFSGFINIGIILFSKDICFEKKAIFSMLPALFASILSIFLIVKTGLVLVVIVSNIFGVVLKLALSYIFSQYRPSFRFNYLYFSQLLKFAGPFSVTRMAHFFIDSIDRILAFSIFGSVFLGIYESTRKIGVSVVSDGVALFDEMLFPVYSRYSRDKTALSHIYFKVVSFTTAILLILMFFLFLGSAAIVRYFLHLSFSEAKLYFNTFICYSFFACLGGQAAILFNGLGLPSLNLRFQIYRIVIMMLMFLFLIPYLDLYGIVLSFCCSGILVSVVEQIVAFNILKKRGISND